jgi:hypothetical protein
MHVGSASVDAVAGDLYVGVGETPAAGATFLNSLILRGGGAAATFPNRVSLQIFGGRTAQPTLIRSLFGGVSSELGQDHLFGGQALWLSASHPIAIGGGWARSRFSDGPAQDNLFEVIEIHGQLDRALRLLLEQSRTGDYGRGRESGYAITVEPRVLLRLVNLTGSLRYVSPQFHAPAGSGFFATLRRSYNVTGAIHPAAGLAVQASAGQSKSFSIFDPENVGTVSRSRGVSAAYSLFRRVSFFTSYSQSNLQSEPGAVIATDSTMSTVSGGATWNVLRAATSVQISQERVANGIDRALDFDGNRVQVDEDYNWQDELGLFGRAHYADGQRNDGSGRVTSYGAALGARRSVSSLLSLNAQAGFTITPAGVALFGTRTLYVTLGASAMPTRGWSQLNAQLTYQRLEYGTSLSRSAWLLMLNANRLLQWGGLAPPLVPFETRAMRIAEAGQSTAMPSWIAVIVFEDANGDGKLSPGEHPVSGAVLQVNGQRITTDSHGRARATARAGQNLVHLLPEGAALDFFAPATLQQLDVQSGDTGSVVFPLLSAGRLKGIVRPIGQLPPALLRNLRIIATRGLFTRGTLTDERGEFSLGVVPVGEYSIAIDPATLPRDVAVEGATEATVTVGARAVVEVEFTIRRATARERLGVDTTRLR